jgi:hypothetical protein
MGNNLPILLEPGRNTTPLEAALFSINARALIILAETECTLLLSHILYYSILLTF